MLACICRRFLGFVVVKTMQYSVCSDLLFSLLTSSENVELIKLLGHVLCMEDDLL